MLFVAALSDKALGLFNGPEERDRVCKYLSLVTYRLLNPSRYEPLLSQEDLGLPPAVKSASGWTNEDLRRALLSQNHSDSFPVSWPTDYIISLVGFFMRRRILQMRESGFGQVLASFPYWIAHGS